MRSSKLAYSITIEIVFEDLKLAKIQCDSTDPVSRLVEKIDKVIVERQKIIKNFDYPLEYKLNGRNSINLNRADNRSLLEVGLEIGLVANKMRVSICYTDELALNNTLQQNSSNKLTYFESIIFNSITIGSIAGLYKCVSNYKNHNPLLSSAAKFALTGATLGAAITSTACFFHKNYAANEFQDISR